MQGSKVPRFQGSKVPEVWSGLVARTEPPENEREGNPTGQERERPALPQLSALSPHPVSSISQREQDLGQVRRSNTIRSDPPKTTDYLTPWRTFILDRSGKDEKCTKRSISIRLELIFPLRFPIHRPPWCNAATQHRSDHRLSTIDHRRATMQNMTCNLQSATCSLQPCNVQRATSPLFVGRRPVQAGNRVAHPLVSA